MCPLGVVAGLVVVVAWVIGHDASSMEGDAEAEVNAF
jgi:hypothetical protein